LTFALLNLAWKLKGMKSSTKFVMIALCDYANKETFLCFPSHNSIARRTCLSASTVQRAIKDLCDLGLISYANRYDDKGNYTSNHYFIQIDRLSELAQSKSAHIKMTPPPSHDDHRGIVKVTDKPLPPTFNLTNKFKNFGEEVVGTNFDRRPISHERMLEICKEMGYKLD
jgi:predicted transcriptional regulator